MTETTTRTRRSHAERRRLSQKKLIESALSIASEKGVSAATFDAIGARAGYSRGLASQKFGSKRGFLNAVIDHLHEVRAQSQDYARLSKLNGLEALLTFVETHLQALVLRDDARAYFIFLAGTVAELNDLRSVFADSHDRAKYEIMELFARGQKDGTIRPGIDAEAASLMIGSLVIGLSMQALTDPDMDLARVVGETRSVLRASFASP